MRWFVSADGLSGSVMNRRRRWRAVLGQCRALSDCAAGSEGGAGDGVYGEAAGTDDEDGGHEVVVGEAVAGVHLLGAERSGGPAHGADNKREARRGSRPISAG